MIVDIQRLRAVLPEVVRGKLEHSIAYLGDGEFEFNYTRMALEYGQARFVDQLLPAVRVVTGDERFAVYESMFGFRRYVSRETPDYASGVPYIMGDRDSWWMRCMGWEHAPGPSSKDVLRQELYTVDQYGDNCNQGNWLVRLPWGHWRKMGERTVRPRFIPEGEIA